MAGTNYTGLTVEVRKSDDGQFYNFGVDIDGEFAIFFVRKAGGLDDAIARAKEASAKTTPHEPAPATTQ